MSDTDREKTSEPAVSGDELAGVVDLFGALTEGELREAVAELAFKRGERASNIGQTIERAVSEYRLVTIDPEDSVDRNEHGTNGEHGRDERLFAAGPTAFPTLPPGAEDLPHILTIEHGAIDRERLAADVEQRFRADAARAVVRGDNEAIERLFDVSFDLEAWGPLDLRAARDRLDSASEPNESADGANESADGANESE